MDAACPAAARWKTPALPRQKSLLQRQWRHVEAKWRGLAHGGLELIGCRPAVDGIGAEARTATRLAATNLRSRRFRVLVKCGLRNHPNRDRLPDAVA